MPRLLTGSIAPKGGTATLCFTAAAGADASDPPPLTEELLPPVLVSTDVEVEEILARALNGSERADVELSLPTSLATICEVASFVEFVGAGALSPSLCGCCPAPSPALAPSVPACP